ncbi:hypothetical protein [Thalassotalea mangrovi]|uniref:hypothetical protein n=1 Tax=Thalassotalea mangrovi TaxID=2572245 RepID=UPI00145F3F71|nr:hypothetical protein [Thalassotalea mangrovi]
MALEHDLIEQLVAEHLQLTQRAEQAMLNGHPQECEDCLSQAEQIWQYLEAAEVEQGHS